MARAWFLTRPPILSAPDHERAWTNLLLQENIAVLEINRRAFMGGALAASAAGTVLGANDRINVGVIGLRGRGRDHIESLAGIDGCRIAGICDIDEAQIGRAQELLAQLKCPPAKAYRDLRQMLESKDIDAVSVATPNHWHVLATVWACQAGKDVYVEKPLSHNIWEGRRAVEAARKYDRIVQVGMQARSLEHYRRAIDLVQHNAIGKVYLAKCLCYKRRMSIGRKPDGPVPPGVDYELWRGPAGPRPFNPNRFHYNWHWFWDTGNGDIANQGVHEMDIARWGLGKHTAPGKVSSLGGKFVYDDDQETPNTQLAAFRYDDCQQEFEVRGLITGGEGEMVREDDKHYIGVIFLGSEGYLTVDCNGFQVFMGEKRERTQHMNYTESEEWATRPHFENFLKAVRSRKTADLNCDVLEGHISATLCHIANTSYRVGRLLSFDAETERYRGDEEANKFLSRSYRAPFVVPTKV
jgi:predicted dehydrogenase